MRKLLTVLLLTLAGPALAVDPPWTQQYNFAQSPEGNGFTRMYFDYDGADVLPGQPGSPVVTEVTSGPPANRRVDIETVGYASVTFVTTNIPSLDPAVGVTLEWRCSVIGEGMAVGSFKFLGYALTVGVRQDEAFLTVSQPGSSGGSTTTTAQTGANSTQTTWRVTFAPNLQARLYRNGTLLVGPVTVGYADNPYQAVTWGGEQGGTQSYTVLRWYQGGAVAP